MKSGSIRSAVCAWRIRKPDSTRYFSEVGSSRGFSQSWPSSTLLSRTSTTSIIWKMRSDIEKERKLNHSFKELQDEAKSPNESQIKLPLNFQSDKRLCSEYLRFDGGVRFELLLEDLDAAAGNVAFSHSYAGYPNHPQISFVTAACDGISMNRRFPMDKDLELFGYVSWVGSSSMEIVLEVRETALQFGTPILKSFFVMVSKDDKTGKPCKINPLKIENPEAQWKFLRGESNKKRRKEERSISLNVVEPTPKEMALIHNLILENKSEAAKSASLIVPMASTQLESVTITQPQDQNTRGNIFGGFLMKKAFELARSVSYLYCGPNSHPFFLAVDDITFLRPVLIGSLIRFKAKVAYYAGPPSRAFQVLVTSEITNLQTGEVDTSNFFHLTFATEGPFPPQILPETYLEAMDYLDGKRRFEHSKEAALISKSTLYEFY